MLLPEIAYILEAVYLTGHVPEDSYITTCSASYMMSDVLAGFSDNCVLLTSLSTVQVVRTALLAGINAVVFVKDAKPSTNIIEIAVNENLPLYSSPLSMFVAGGRLYNAGLTGQNNAR